jgi:uncharacterized protein
VNKNNSFYIFVVFECLFIAVNKYIKKRKGGTYMYYHYPTPHYDRNQVEGHGKKNIFKVYGEGKVTAIPNQASATIGVITEGKDLTETQKQNSETITRIVEALNSFQIPPGKIQTFDYQVNTEYDYVDGKQIFRGYRVTNLLKITIDDIKQLGNIINRVIEAGANYVSNVQFNVSNPNEYYLRALRKALHNAYSKAETMAMELKVKWDTTPIRVEEVGKDTGPIRPQMAFVKGVSTEQFQPGTLEFTAMVEVRYQFMG